MIALLVDNALVVAIVAIVAWTWIWVRVADALAGGRNDLVLREMPKTPRNRNKETTGDDCGYSQR